MRRNKPVCMSRPCRTRAVQARKKPRLAGLTSQCERRENRRHAHSVAVPCSCEMPLVVRAVPAYRMRMGVKKPALGGLVIARSAGRLLLPQLRQCVLQRLDEALDILRRHLNPGGGDWQTRRSLSCVLQANQWLPILGASPDAGELEAGCWLHIGPGIMKKPARCGLVEGSV